MKTGWSKMFGGLVPADQEAADWLARAKEGVFVYIEIISPRNYKFHKKYFALLKFAYEHWDIPDDSAEKNYKQFRSDLTIMAGYYHKVWNVKGELRLRAKSIAFSNMDEVEFQGLYDKTVTLILENILSTYTEEDITKAMNAMAGFV